MSEPFSVRHRVQFYETDQMGIVHHSNYLRIFEEARVAWAHSKGLIDYQKPESAAHFAVLETRVCHKGPSFFGDELKTEIQAKGQGIRIIFQYRLSRGENIVALGETSHAALNTELKPVRPTPDMVEALRSESWTETWL